MIDHAENLPGPRRQADQTSRASTNGAPTRKLRVLVADDTPGNHKVMQRILGNRGHEAIVARNGKEALCCAMYGHFDVVLMDVQMPLMDGYEVTRTVRQYQRSHNEYTPIIALTVHQGDADRERCLAAGMDAFLTKPIDAGQLIETVESVADGRFNRLKSGRVEPQRSCGPRWQGKSLVDFEGCMRRLNGDIELFREFVEIFREDSPALLESIRQGAASHDGPLLARGAHSIKGLTSNFGARCAVEAARQLEDIGINERWDEVPQALQLLEETIARLHEELEAFRGDVAGKTP